MLPIVGNGKEGKIWCCWLLHLVLTVGERRRGFGEFGAGDWCFWLLLFVLKFNFRPLSASLC